MGVIGIPELIILTPIAAALYFWVWRPLCRKIPQLKTIAGLAFLITGGLMFVWTRNHSPYMSTNEKMLVGAQIILDEGSYYIWLVVSLIILLIGITVIAKRYLPNNKLHTSNRPQNISRLDELKKAKELLDAGVINEEEFNKIKQDELQK